MSDSNTKKRAFNWCFVSSFVLLFVSQAITKWVHIVLGVLFLILLIYHVSKYAKWYKASIKAFFKAKLKGRARTRYLIVCGMLVVLTIVFVSGFVSVYELITAGEVSGGVHRIHNAMSLIVGLLTALHLAFSPSRKRRVLARQEEASKQHERRC